MVIIPIWTAFGRAIVRTNQPRRAIPATTASSDSPGVRQASTGRSGSPTKQDSADCHTDGMLSAQRLG